MSTIFNHGCGFEDRGSHQTCKQAQRCLNAEPTSRDVKLSADHCPTTGTHQGATPPPWLWPRAAYIHVPFCAHHCGYCDFAIATGVDHQIDLYIEALGEDVRRRVRESQGVNLEWEIKRIGVPAAAEVRA